MKKQTIIRELKEFKSAIIGDQLTTRQFIVLTVSVFVLSGLVLYGLGLLMNVIK